MAGRRAQTGVEGGAPAVRSKRARMLSVLRSLCEILSRCITARQRNNCCAIAAIRLRSSSVKALRLPGLNALRSVSSLGITGPSRSMG